MLAQRSGRKVDEVRADGRQRGAHAGHARKVARKRIEAHECRLLERASGGRPTWRGESGAERREQRRRHGARELAHGEPHVALEVARERERVEHAAQAIERARAHARNKGAAGRVRQAADGEQRGRERRGELRHVARAALKEHGVEAAQRAVRGEPRRHNRATARGRVD